MQQVKFCRIFAHGLLPLALLPWAYSALAAKAEVSNTMGAESSSLGDRARQLLSIHLSRHNAKVEKASFGAARLMGGAWVTMEAAAAAAAAVTAVTTTAIVVQHSVFW